MGAMRRWFVAAGVKQIYITNANCHGCVFSTLYIFEHICTLHLPEYAPYLHSISGIGGNKRDQGRVRIRKLHFAKDHLATLYQKVELVLTESVQTFQTTF